MFAVNKNGDRLEVDDSNVDCSKGYHSACCNFVAMYDDDIKLKRVWILQLQKDINGFQGRAMELELVKEVKFDHGPTENEILYRMSECGLGFQDVATVVKGYVLDYRE